MFRQNKNIIYISIVGFIGLTIFFVIYSEILDPRYTAWLINTGPDTIQSYIGWLVYNSSSWTFPLGLTTNLAYPLGVSITYTDSIPLLAIFFKLFSLHNFQYFGWWIASCFILQSIFGYLLLKKILNHNVLAVLGSIIFTLSPIMLFRLGGHFALGGQWLILAGIYLIIRESKKLNWYSWSILLVLSLLIHPYLFFMNGFLMLTYLLYFIKNKIVVLKQILLFLFIQIIISLVVAYSLGLFVIGETGAPGFGSFSMNLNALVNPLGWSRILPNLEIPEYQNEGFNYLGIGVLYLLILSIITYFKDNSWKQFVLNQWPIILMSVILFLLAISNIIIFNSQILVNLPLSKTITEDIFGLIRASGRLFWPVYYLLVLASFYVIKKYKFKIGLLILLFALSLQVFDLSLKIKDRGEEFVDQEYISILTPEFKELAEGYEHLVFLPVIPHKNYSSFVFYAVDNNLTINDGYFARPIAGLEEYKNTEIEKIKQGYLDKETIYIFSREADSFLLNIDLDKHYLLNLDNTVVLFPYCDKN